MFFEGLDCVEVVLVVGFEPGMVSLEGVGVEVGVGCRADECVDLVHHCVACGDYLGKLGLEDVRITELVEGSFEYLGTGWWCELAGGLLERGDQLVLGYVLGRAWLIAGGIVFAVAPPDTPLVAAASVPGFRPVPSPTAPALDFRGERVAKGTRPARAPLAN